MRAQNWWEPYEEAGARGSRMSVHDPERSRAATVDDAIHDALCADAAGWFAKKGDIR